MIPECFQEDLKVCAIKSQGLRTCANYTRNFGAGVCRLGQPCLRCTKPIAITHPHASCTYHAHKSISPYPSISNASRNPSKVIHRLQFHYLSADAIYALTTLRLQHPCLKTVLALIFFTLKLILQLDRTASAHESQKPAQLLLRILFLPFSPKNLP